MNILNRLHICLLGILLLAISACNTVEGVGEDVQKGGKHIEDSAKKNK